MVIGFLIPNTQHQFAIGNAFNHLMAVLGPWLANSSRGNGLPQLLLSPATAHAEKHIVDIDICCDQFCKWLELRQTSTTGPALSTFVHASWWFCLPVPLLSQVSVSMEHKLSFGTSSIPIVSSMCLENAPTFHSVFPNYTSFNLEPSKSESNRLGMVLLSQEISRCDDARLNAEIYWRQFPMWITVAWRHASCPFFLSVLVLMTLYQTNVEMFGKQKLCINRLVHDMFMTNNATNLPCFMAQEGSSRGKNQHSKKRDLLNLSHGWKGASHRLDRLPGLRQNHPLESHLGLEDSWSTLRDYWKWVWTGVKKGTVVVSGTKGTKLPSYVGIVISLR